MTKGKGKEPPKPGASPWEGGPIIVEFEAPDFSCEDPKTGAPECGYLRIRYRPQAQLLDREALTAYLRSYRGQKIPQEAAVSTIATDVAKAIDPAWVLVRVEFVARNGISSWPVAACIGTSPVDPEEIPHWDSW